MKKIFLFTMIASCIIATSTRSIVRPPGGSRWPSTPFFSRLTGPYYEQFKSRLQKLGIKMDVIRKKSAQQKLVLARLNKAQTIDTITFYISIRKGIEKLKQKISWSKSQLRTWSWVLLPKLKSNIKNNITKAENFKSRLEELLNQMETQYPKLAALKL